MQNSEVSYIWYLIGWIVKTYDYFLYVVSSLPQSVCVGYVDNTLLSLLCIT